MAATHPSFHQQQIALDQTRILRASSGSGSQVHSGQTPSPLKSMAELIRQTQEQLKHLTPEMINAQVAAELANQAFGGAFRGDSSQGSSHVNEQAFGESRAGPTMPGG